MNAKIIESTIDNEKYCHRCNTEFNYDNGPVNMVALTLGNYPVGKYIYLCEKCGQKYFEIERKYLFDLQVKFITEKELI